MLYTLTGSYQATDVTSSSSHQRR